MTALADAGRTSCVGRRGRSRRGGSAGPLFPGATGWVRRGRPVHRREAEHDPSPGRRAPPVAVRAGGLVGPVAQSRARGTSCRPGGDGRARRPRSRRRTRADLRHLSRCHAVDRQLGPGGRQRGARGRWLVADAGPHAALHTGRFGADLGTSDRRRGDASADPRRTDRGHLPAGRGPAIGSRGSDPQGCRLDAARGWPLASTRRSCAASWTRTRPSCPGPPSAMPSNGSRPMCGCTTASSAEPLPAETLRPSGSLLPCKGCKDA